ncbi:ribonuclease HI [Alphaproteobacteria bacterium]|nr:ribonuclease HI [Alphaproteobacteria bacterium]
MSIAVYTDGACSGNPGIGGWGAVVLIDDLEPIHLYGGSDYTTNNQMELTAVIEALIYFSQSTTLNFFTDSKYVKEGIELWVNKWKKNGWKTAAKKPVKNKELWMKLDALVVKHTINWQWVKGHAGNVHNETADYLARKYIEDR